MNESTLVALSVVIVLSIISHGLTARPLTTRYVNGISDTGDRDAG